MKLPITSTRNCLLTLFGLLSFAFANTVIDPSTLKQSLEITLNDRCGNVEFDVNFLYPRISIFDSNLLKNVILTDLMEEANQLDFVLNG